MGIAIKSMDSRKSDQFKSSQEASAAPIVQSAKPPLWVWIGSGLFIASSGLIGLTLWPSIKVIAPILMTPNVTERYEFRYIPSTAMEPTLQLNDRIVVDTKAYQKAPVSRGDIIIFYPPEEAISPGGNNDEFVKRVVGLSGETVHVTQNRVFVNKNPLSEPYIEDSPNYEWGPVVVPPNAYVVLGDKRNNSYDSHIWGFASDESVTGKVTHIYWTLARTGELKP